MSNWPPGPRSVVSAVAPTVTMMLPVRGAASVRAAAAAGACEREGSGAFGGGNDGFGGGANSVTGSGGACGGGGGGNGDGACAGAASFGWYFLLSARCPSSPQTPHARFSLTPTTLPPAAPPARSPLDGPPARTVAAVCCVRATAASWAAPAACFAASTAAAAIVPLAFSVPFPFPRPAVAPAVASAADTDAAVRSARATRCNSERSHSVASGASLAAPAMPRHSLITKAKRSALNIIPWRGSAPSQTVAGGAANNWRRRVARCSTSKSRQCCAVTSRLASCICRRSQWAFRCLVVTR